jgi:hypothetical protein
MGTLAYFARGLPASNPIPHNSEVNPEDSKAPLVVLDSLVKRSRIRRVMTE